MRCPQCKADNDRVLGTRSEDNGAVIRRRRECRKCKTRFTTHERVDEFLPRVIKKDGSRESFSREKLLSGVQRALEKRPVDEKSISSLIEDTIQELKQTGEREVAASHIGDVIMRRLKDLDQVGYVRFASVYRDFKTVDEFYYEVEFVKKVAILEHPPSSNS